MIRASFSSDDSSRDVVRAALTDVDARARVLALRAGSRHTWLSFADWVRALADPDADVRREAANLVAAHPRDDALAPFVIAVLRDPDPLVVDAAAFALGEWECVDAVDALVDVARTHEDARCREGAVAALGSIGDDRGRATVIAALEDKPPVRRRAVVALSNFEGLDVEAALEVAREDRDWQVRAAVDQLGRAPDELD